MTDTSPLDDSTEERSSAAMEMSKLAASRKRRESTKKEVERERPQYILEIEQSDVAYTLPPPMMPLVHVNYREFAQAMRDEYGLELDLSSVKLDPMIMQQISKEVETSGEDLEAALMRHALKDRESELTFRGGRYWLTRTEFVPINAVKINFESVIVSVGGIEKVAEAVAAEIFDLTSLSAKFGRSWSQIQDQIRVVGYATKTRVDLGSENAFERLLSPQVLDFMDSEMVAGERFAAHYGSYHARDNLEAPPEDFTSLSFALDDLHFYISQFDKRTGMLRQGQIRFTVTGRGDYRSGEVAVWSEFPYRIHEQFLGQLIEAIQAKD